MAKAYYKIPADLNASYLDMELAIRSSDGIGVKPIPMKIIFAYLLSGLVCLWSVLNTFIAQGTIVQKFLYVVLWAALTVLLCSYDNTHRMKAALIPVLLSYFSKANRVLMTRNASDAIPFYTLVGIKKDGIDKKTGLISFDDGTYGYMYRVVGSASVLLFESDKTAILDRVDSFYRKLGTEAELIFLTTKSSQVVYRQVAALKRTYDDLVDRDPDLLALANEQFSVLKDYVGGSFKAIHQYLIIKGDNKEVLQQTKAVLQAELEGSSLMIKRAVTMGFDDITEVLHMVFTGKEVRR